MATKHSRISASVAIQAKGLRKSYGEQQVLKGVDFTLEQGSILALLGPNGAGKTTTIRILSTLLKPDEGSASVNGFDVVKKSAQVRASIGLTGQFAAVDDYLTGRENILMIGQLYHLPAEDLPERTRDLLEQLDLVDAADRPARTYSGGMKRRLDLAMSLVASPAILFLDEPTTGLDPRSRLALWHMIKELARGGTTILLTTQYMEEAEYLADNVIVIDHGQVIAEGTVSELKAQAGAERVEVTLKRAKDLHVVRKLAGAEASSDEETLMVTAPARKGAESLYELLGKLNTAKIPLESAALRRPTLDDVFLALTGHATEEEAAKEAKHA